MKKKEPFTLETRLSLIRLLFGGDVAVTLLYMEDGAHIVKVQFMGLPAPGLEGSGGEPEEPEEEAPAKPLGDIHKDILRSLLRELEANKEKEHKNTNYWG